MDSFATSKRPIALLLVLAVSGWTADAQQSFDPPIDFFTPTGLQFLTAGDVDGDGDKDLVIALSSPPQLLFVFNPGSVTLSIGTGTVSLTFLPRRVLIADIDGDGDGDLVAEDAGPASMATVRILRNDGGLTFTELTPPSFVHGIRYLTSGDLDADGDVDFTATFETGITLFSNDGNGLFTPGLTVVPSSLPLAAAEVADMNGDGQADLVLVGGPASDSIQVLIWSGTRFVTATDDTYPDSLTAPVLADMDGDGDLDAVVAAVSQLTGASQWYVLHNDGTGVLSAAAAMPLNSGVLGLAAGDLDGDGLPEVVAAHLGSQSMTVLSNGGPTGFTAQTLGLPYFAGGVLLADIDGDGDRDIVTRTAAFGGPDAVRVFLNRHVPNFLSLEIVSGDGQPGIIGLPFQAPLVVRVTAPGGTVIQGAPVSFLAEDGGALAGANPATTDSQGLAQIGVVARPTPGFQRVRINVAGGHPSGIIATLSSQGATTISLFSGNNQNADVGAPFPLPIVVLVTDTLSGSPIASTPVYFASDGTGIFASAIPVLTDANGLASVNFIAGLLPRLETVSATTPGALIPVNFTLTTTTSFSGAVNLTHYSGNNQVLDFGEAWPVPASARVCSPTNVGIANVPVTFQYTQGMGSIATQTVYTDVAGVAQVMPIAGAFAGTHSVTVTLPLGGAPALVFTARVRGLGVAWSSTTGTLFVLYQNGAFNFVPLIVAADSPLPNGPLVTPFGSIATSILLPGPNFVSLDGLGVFGPPDPSIFAFPIWGRFFQIAAPPPPGTLAVLQVYGFDSSLGVTPYFSTNFVHLLF